MKRCGRCTKWKPFTEFTGDRRRKDGLSCYCKNCASSYASNHRNPAAANIRAQRRHRSGRQWLNDYKRSRPCADCGGHFEPCQMDFDHKPGQTKLFNVGNAASHSRQAIEREIDKCDLVCANCHRLRTYNRRQSTGVDAA